MRRRGERKRRPRLTQSSAGSHQPSLTIPESLPPVMLSSCLHQMKAFSVGMGRPTSPGCTSSALALEGSRKALNRGLYSDLVAYREHVRIVA